ncbi:MAG TPA: hypothetical protein VG992_00940 [Candidatus Saccharimonadales bacterium]|nr:hypothetical protein [Candidatus Saccharimonadales bacterium]
MKKIHNESGNIGLIALALVAGLVIAFAGTKAADNHKLNDAKKPTSTTAAADLRSSLVTLGVQHMDLTDQAVDAALDGSSNAAATGAALYANGNDIGAAVGSVYGKSAETTFDSVWKLHLDEFVKYAVADAKGDGASKAAALKAIATGYTKPLSAYLAKANPNLPEATLEKVLGEHVGMTAQMIDDHVQGKYADEAAELKQADQHIATIFSTLAGGIVQQYPDKFQN